MNKINTPIRESTHFKAVDDIVFTARTFSDEQSVRAVPVYRPQAKGDRISIQNWKAYVKDLDEFGTRWFAEQYPSYMKNSLLGSTVVVPLEEITQVYDPFSAFERVKHDLRRTYWAKVISAVSEIVPEEDMGVIGSRLVNLEVYWSDLDLLIRGKENMLALKEAMSDIRRSIDAKEMLDKGERDVKASAYGTVYNPTKNSFARMINNRWSTLRTDDFMMKLLFTAASQEELPLKDPTSTAAFESEIEGVVTDDTFVGWMPRSFVLETKDMQWAVGTYFWHFYYSVRKGDKVSVTGKVFPEEKQVWICDRREHGIKIKSES